LKPPFRFLELGAGTGKFTTQFLPLLNSYLTHHEDEEMRKFYVNAFPSFYGAVEPIESMLSVLKRWDFRHWMRDEPLTADVETSPRLPLLHIPGEVKDLPEFPMLSDTSCIFAAQSFHWFATLETLRICHRFLKAEDGKLVLIWNNRDLSVPYLQEIEELLKPLYVRFNTPRQQYEDWKRLIYDHYEEEKEEEKNEKEEGNDIFSTTQRGPLFTFSQSASFKHPIVTRPTLVVERILSTSVVQLLEREEIDRFDESVKAILKNHQLWDQERVEFPHSTDVFILDKV
jgi:SAM-dependent methyltransferase